MAAVNTPITRLLGIRTPVVLAPMAFASGGALASEVALAGGFGFIGSGYTTLENFRSQIALVRSLLNLPSGPLPIGASFLGWVLDRPESKSVEILHEALNIGVRAIWLSFGNDLGHWVDVVRSHDQKAGRDSKTLIFIQVNSAEQALTAVRDWKADVLIAQGIEAGGHGSASAPPLLTLIPSVLSVLPHQNPPPLLAAGGVTNGAQLAACIALGTAGAVIGTRFLLTPESQYSDAQKAALIAAKTGDTARSMVFDILRGTTGWPDGIDGRCLRIPSVQEFEDKVKIEDIQRRFDEGASKGDPKSMVIWAGTGVGLIDEIKPAKAIVEELHASLIERLQAASSLV
ncbi:hypothetical protein HETIRDRAFT_420140 [Heterobasidion irregulare TC 32-1]|uniref:Nitronate monooxygenase domain-containing protein n=1 Tax=Heterobasidion irregulare (strain TC 32-1) TaxID=747525 RepID=W4JZP7_HETIT|nr:uncharacterized protein HETIRDRAFT_420140 [Heterobasidion irregulare TC 32-1]ETW78949.1 hypothetical protein HETIRDRAFT_420140 [Heterobasidion irregulare TC 32-1]